jgi:hypothetical protein
MEICNVLLDGDALCFCGLEYCERSDQTEMKSPFFNGRTMTSRNMQ